MLGKFECMQGWWLYPYHKQEFYCIAVEIGHWNDPDSVRWSFRVQIMTVEL